MSEEDELVAWRGDRRLRGLLLRYSLLTAAVSGAILAAFLTLSELNGQAERIDAIRLGVNQLLIQQLNEETGIRGFGVTADRRYLQPYFNSRHEIEASLVRLSSISPARERDTEALADIASLHREWERTVADRVLADPRNSADPSLQLNGKALVDQIRIDVATIDEINAVRGYRVDRRIALVLFAVGLSVLGAITIMGAIAYVTERRSLYLQERLFRSLAETRDTATRVGEWRMKVIAMLAHDFKSALAVISACASVLEEFPERRDDPGPYGGIHDAVDQLAKMTDEALLMARIASDSLPPMNHEPIEIAPLLEHIADRYRNGRTITITPSHEKVLGEESYLVRAFDNLISNATKYSENTKAVRVGVTRDADEVEIAVTDEGEGIDPSDLPHVFDAYWRSARAGGAGSGLGLFIVQKIVEAHHGNVDIMSIPGSGTTIYVRLPAA